MDCEGGDIKNESQSSKLIFFMNRLLGPEQQLMHYSIIGLTNRVCLIEWVEHTDTLANVISQQTAKAGLPSYSM